MLRYFSFHNKYITHSNLLIRTLYFIICILYTIFFGAIFCIITIYIIIQIASHQAQKQMLASPYKIESKASILSRLYYEREFGISNYVIAL